MKKIVLGVMGFVLIAGTAFAETTTLDSLKQQAAAKKESFGAQIGQKASTLKATGETTYSTVNAQAKKTAEELKVTGQSAYATVNAEAQKTAAEVKQTSQDSAKIFQEQFNKSMNDLQASLTKALTDLNRQIEDFKAQFIASQKKA